MTKRSAVRAFVVFVACSASASSGIIRTAEFAKNGVFGYPVAPSP